MSTAPPAGRAGAHAALRLPRRAAAAAAALIALVVLGAAATPAPAQPSAPGAARRAGSTAAAVRLEVSRMTGVLTDGGDFDALVVIRSTGAARLDDLRLVASLHRRVTSRFEYQQAVDEGRVGGVSAAFTTDLAPIGPGGVRVVSLARSAAELGFARPADKYGVYPLQLRLESGDATLAEVTTSLVLSPPQVSAPVAALLLVPLDAPLALLPGGRVITDRLAGDVSGRGRLAALMEALDEHDGTAAVLAPSGLLLEQLATLATGTAGAAPDGRTPPGVRAAAAEAEAFLAQVRAVASRDEVDTVALAYGPADLVALVRAGLGPEAARHISVGRVTVENLTGARPERGVLWPAAGLDPATLTEVLGAGIDAVVLSERYLDIPPDRPLRFSPAAVRRLRTPAGSTLPVAVPDPWLEASLGDMDARAGAAVAAQRILAETAVVYFERPFLDETRGIVLAPPQVWEPPPGAADALLEGLGQAPWLRPSGVGEFLRSVDAEREAIRLDYPTAARADELPADYVGELAEARRLLGSLASVAVEDGRPSQFDRLLLAAASVHYRPAVRRPEGRALVSAVAGTVADLARALSVAQDIPVTLTDITGRVPVTLRSDAEVPLQVQVRLVGSRYRFPAGAAQQIVLRPQTTTTVAFLVEALTPGGTYPIQVRVEDEEGALLLAQGSVVVRSTAYPVTALLLTGGAAAFLLVWWVRDTRRRWRRDREPRRGRSRAAAGV